jgi:hypothetical protein
MTTRRLISAAIVTVLLVISATAYAQDCNSGSASVAQPVVFPNRAAGPVASASPNIIGVAKNATDGSNAIWFATYDRNLNQLTPDRLVTPGSAERAIKLLWTGTEFGLFYRTPGSQIALQRASVTGELIGPPVIIAPHNASNDQQSDFIWDPTRQLYLIPLSVRSGFNPGLHLVGVTREGVVQLDQLVSFFIGDDPAPQIAITPSGVIGIVWGYSPTGFGSGLTFVAIDSANVPHGFVQITVQGTAARIATDGTLFAIAFSATKPSGSGTEIHWVRTSAATGEVVFNERNLLTGSGVDAAPVSLLWNPLRFEWALAYLDAVIGFNGFPPEYRLARFASDGTRLGDSLFSDDPLKSIVSSPYPIVISVTGYLGSTERSFGREQGSESYLVRNCPLTAAITPSRQPVVGVPISFTASITGGVGPFTYFWDFGDARFATSANPLQSYQQPGTYHVTLTVTDSTGATFVARQTYAVASDPCNGIPLVLPITVTADKPLTIPNELVTFRAAPINLQDAPVLFGWTFGDGTTAVPGSIVTHRFTKTGTYTVTATPSLGACPAVSGTSVVVRVTVSSKRRAVR